MGNFNFLDGLYEERNFNKVDQTIDSRHNKHLGSMRSSIETQIPIRTLKGDFILSHSFNSFTKHLKFLIQPLSHSFFPFFLLNFLVIRIGSLLEIEILSLNTSFSIKLNIQGLFLPQHDRLMQVEMQQNNKFPITILEKGMFNIRIIDLNGL